MESFDDQIQFHGKAVNERFVSDYYISYCLCNEILLITEIPVSSLQRRDVDLSWLVPKEGFKLNVQASKVVLIQREHEVERQYRFECQNCSLPVGYSDLPWENTQKRCFLFHQSFVSQPGRIPESWVKEWKELNLE